MNRRKFELLWKLLKKRRFYCINADDVENAFEYFSSGTAIRFAKEGRFIPNIELKKVKNSLDEYSLENSMKIKINDHRLNISPLELQIAYKLFLDSQKDLEDARFLFKITQDRIDVKKLKKFLEILNVKRRLVREWLGIEM